MAVDFSQYQPPGVYLEFQEPTQTVGVGVAPTVVAILGPSVGYLLHSEPVALTGTTAVALSKLGANPSSVAVAAGDGTVYAADQYALVAGAGADGNIGTTKDNTLTIARTVGSAIPDGGTVFVSYQYTDDNYGSPKAMSDFDDVVSVYGEPMNLDDNTIRSPLSLAARMAFENGTRNLILVAVDGTASAVTRTALNSAYSQIATLREPNIVVPLPVGLSGTEAAPGDTSGVASDLRTHLENASADRLYRVGIIGYEKGSTVQPSTLAAAVDSGRVQLVWPNRYNFYNGSSGDTIEVSGYYLAAALAGRLAAQRVSEPSTRKQLRGFAGLPSATLSSMTKALKDTYAQAGVAVIEPDALERLVVRHGVSTSTGSIHYREFSLVRARDALDRLVLDSIEASGLVGGIIEETTPLAIKSVVMSALETAVSGRVIISHQSLRVRQLTGDPSVMEVKFAYLPPYPLNYIVVSYSVNVATGEFTTAAAA